MRCIMINAWSLLYDEIYGTNKMTDKDKKDVDEDLFASMDGVDLIGEAGSSWDPVTGSGNTASEYPSSFNTFSVNDDQIAHHVADYEELNLNIHANSPYNDGWTRQAAQEELDKKMAEEPSIKNPCNRKYKEDESIKGLQDYISTTYGGHYTSEQNNVQTLDLIESVGDAEAFCRSNAIKYLSRYDKKGQAKRDILKALHYSLLLYHFSGQTNETPTRGYETF